MSARHTPPPKEEIFSPFNKLAVEVVQMVLRHVIMDAESNTDMFNLICVSKGFRLLCYPIPLLWERIIFIPAAETQLRGKNREFSHSLWFLNEVPKKFHNNSLEISIKDSDKRTLSALDISKMMEIIRASRARYLHRWQSLQINVIKEETLHEIIIFLTGFYGPFPTFHLSPLSLPLEEVETMEGAVNLESLTLSCRTGAQSQRPELFLFRGFPLPNLKRVFLKGAKIDWEQFTGQIMDGTIEEIHLESLHVDHFAQVIRASQDLRELTLINVSIAPPEQSESARTKTNHMKRLSIAWYPSNSVSTAGILASLHPVSLEELVLHELPSDRISDYTAHGERHLSW